MIILPNIEVNTSYKSEKYPVGKMFNTAEHGTLQLIGKPIGEGYTNYYMLVNVVGEKFILHANVLSGRQDAQASIKEAANNVDKFVVVSPVGETYEIQNTPSAKKAFADQHVLSYGSFNSMLLGIAKQSQGWKLVR